jgi:hypothetical protein
MMVKESGGPPDHEKVMSKMKYDYMRAQTDRVHKGLDSLQAAIALSQRIDLDQMGFLQQIVNILGKSFKIKGVTIGLRGVDGNYRYLVMNGLRDEAWEFDKTIVYTEADFAGSKTYKGEMISKLTKLCLAGQELPFPEREKVGFNRPFIMGVQRMSPEDWIEGDYVDVEIRGTRGTLLGWIEVMGMIDGRIPDVTTVKFLETFAGIIAGRIESGRH